MSSKPSHNTRHPVVRSPDMPWVSVYVVKSRQRLDVKYWSVEEEQGKARGPCIEPTEKMGNPVVEPGGSTHNIIRQTNRFLEHIYTLPRFCLTTPFIESQCAPRRSFQNRGGEYNLGIPYQPIPCTGCQYAKPCPLCPYALIYIFSRGVGNILAMHFDLLRSARRRHKRADRM